MPDVRELGSGESHLAARALLELRPEIGKACALSARVDAQRVSGYRLVGSFEEGDPHACAVAGFRVMNNLAWGRFVSVDDLVTCAACRGRGHGDALLAWVETEARRRGCGALHLDSGVGADRADAHRFYFRHGLRISSYHFSIPLG